MESPRKRRNTHFRQGYGGQTAGAYLMQASKPVQPLIMVVAIGRCVPYTTDFRGLLANQGITKNQLRTVRG